MIRPEEEVYEWDALQAIFENVECQLNNQVYLHRLGGTLQTPDLHFFYNAAPVARILFENVKSGTRVRDISFASDCVVDEGAIKSELDRLVSRKIWAGDFLSLISEISELLTEKSLHENKHDQHQKHLFVVHYDHMRQWSSYSKAIRRQCMAEDIEGFLLKHKNVSGPAKIVAVMYGEKSNLEQLVRWNRTACVDVDAKGRKCTEKKLTVVHSSEYSREKGFKGFHVVETTKSLVSEIGGVTIDDGVWLKLVEDIIGCEFRIL